MQRKFIVSGRGIQAPVLETLHQKYKRFLKWGPLDSVFCFAVEYSPLYGGRKFCPEHCFTPEQVEELNKSNIGLELTLSSYYYSEDLYRQTIPILERVENRRNSIMCTNDELAKRVRIDFPQLKVKASSIKMISTHEEIKKAFELYDSIALPPWIVDKGEVFLQGIEEKERIIIFLTCGCAYFCRMPAEKRCYKRFSDFNISPKPSKNPLACSVKVNNFRRVPAAPIEFNINDSMFDGFKYFKLIKKAHPTLFGSVLNHPKFKYSEIQLERLKKLPIVNP